MSDFNSSLPIRTENNGDVAAIMVDGTITSQKASVDSHGSQQAVIADSSGNKVTSQVNGSQQALDVGVNVGGVQIDPRAIRALTSSDVVTANIKDSAGASITLGSHVIASSLPVAIASDQIVNTQDAADGSASGGTAGTKSSLGGAVYNSSAPVLTTGQQAALQSDSSGNLKVNISASSGSLSVTQGTSPWVTSDQADGAIANGSAGSKSSLAGGIYLSAAPTLTTGNQNALLLDVAGNLKVDLATALPAGSNAIGSITNTSFIATQATAANLNATVVGTGTFATQVTSLPSIPAGSNLIGAVNVDIGGTPLAFGQTTMSASIPVTIASNQSNLNVVVASALPAGTNLIGAVNLDIGGSAVSASNPVPVSFSPAPLGTSVNNYNTASAIAANATSNHDYAITSSKTFNGKKIHASSSGMMKIEVQISPDGTTFSSIFVAFNSTASLNIDIDLDELVFLESGTGSKIRVIRTNRDKQAQDVYSTICGQEI